MFISEKLKAAHAEIKQKIDALNFDEGAYLIAHELGRQGFDGYTFTGEHAGRAWSVIYGGKTGVLIQVDGETVLHQNISHYHFEVYTYREWPERDWLPAFSSLVRLANTRKQQKAIAAVTAESDRFERQFGPIRSTHLAAA